MKDLSTPASLPSAKNYTSKVSIDSKTLDDLKLVQYIAFWKSIYHFIKIYFSWPTANVEDNTVNFENGEEYY